MAAVEASIVGRNRGAGLGRRLVLGALALYLAPAILAVLLIGGAGMACCAVRRRLAGGEARPGDLRADGRGAARGVAAPHFGAASRCRSPRR